MTATRTKDNPKQMDSRIVEYKRVLGKHLIIDDWQAVDIIIAVALAHKIKGEMMWLRVIGQSGTGKTEILMSISNCKQENYCAKIECLTPSSIRRGYSPKGEHLETMLERINGKLVITKELAPLLTAKNEEKVAVFGLLRSLHDGEIIADYGSRQGYIEQKCWFDWILAATSYVDRQSQLESQLGTRFMDLRWGAPLDRKKMVAQAMHNDDHLKDVRDEISSAMSDVLAIESNQYLEVDEYNHNVIIDFALVLSKLRTPVLRDIKHNILSPPEPESGTRIGQFLAHLAKGFMLMGISNYIPYLRRLCFDCIPPIRLACVKGCLDGKKQEQIADEVHVSQWLISLEIQNLKLLEANREFVSLLFNNKDGEQNGIS